jgi:threonine/homoserine/homoserine lactone efflux protein
MTITFILTALVIVATPGTGVIFTIAAGLSQGSKASLIAAIGCTLGIFPQMLAAIFGLAAILNASAIAFNSLKFLGVAYLIYLASQTWRDHTPLATDVAAQPKSAWQIIRSAILINLLNPKLTIFFFAFLPAFVRPNEPNAAMKMIGLSGIFMALTFVIFALYGVFASAMRRHVITRPKVIARLRRSFAATYVVLAARIAVQSR